MRYMLFIGLAPYRINFPLSNYLIVEKLILVVFIVGVQGQKNTGLIYHHLYFIPK